MFAQILEKTKRRQVRRLGKVSRGNLKEPVRQATQVVEYNRFSAHDIAPIANASVQTTLRWLRTLADEGELERDGEMGGIPMFTK